MHMGALYEDFGSDDLPAAGKQTGASVTDEDELLQTFENGYQAGWDDSTKAQANLDMSISSALAANLQDASFQYHELRAQLTKTVRDIVQGIVDAVLPDIARQSLGAHIVQLVEAQARNALDRRIELRVPEATVDHVERILPETPIEYDVVPDPTLAPEQAILQLGSEEQVVDLAQVVREVKAAVDAYFETQASGGQND